MPGLEQALDFAVIGGMSIRSGQYAILAAAWVRDKIIIELRHYH